MSRRSAIAALLFFIPVALLTGGCATRGTPTGLSYQDTVQKVDTFLAARVNHGIFFYKKETTPTHTVFRFIEGSARRKVDVICPLRITVTVRPARGGSTAAFDVTAIQQGLKLTKAEPQTAWRWQQTLTGVF